MCGGCEGGSISTVLGESPPAKRMKTCMVGEELGHEVVNVHSCVMASVMIVVTALVSEVMAIICCVESETSGLERERVQGGCGSRSGSGRHAKLTKRLSSGPRASKKTAKNKKNKSPLEGGVLGC